MSFYPSDEEYAEVQKKAIELLSNLGVLSHQGLKFDSKINGYKDFTYGGKAGPSTDVCNIFHEIAHSIEFGSKSFHKRVYKDKGSYKFKLPKLWVYDRYCIEPVTTQATERELRTIAIQTLLLLNADSSLKYENTIESHVSAMEYMPDWLCFSPTEKSERFELYRKMIRSHFDTLDINFILNDLKLWLDKTHVCLQRINNVV